MSTLLWTKEGETRSIPVDGDACGIIEVPESIQWNSLAQLLIRKGIDTCVSVFSGITQLREPLVRMHRQAGIPFCYCSPGQLQALPVIARAIDSSMMIVTRDVLEQVLHANISVDPIKSAVVICGVHDLPYSKTTSLNLHHEIHAVPGVPLLTQCEIKEQAAGLIFHLLPSVSVSPSEVFELVGYEGLCRVHLDAYVYKPARCVCGIGHRVILR